MDVVINDGTLLLLPDPVTCFRSASFNQIQTFRLTGDSSAALLDWVTAGRRSLGEEWDFSRYYSVNEVWINGKRIARDVVLLQNDGDNTPLNAKLAPYTCYATLILYGPLMKNTIRHLSELFGSISVFKSHRPADLIWSFSPIFSGAGCAVRVGGTNTESVKRWLRNALIGLEDILGIDVYRRAFI
jgi:urease accessory protein